MSLLVPAAFADYVDAAHLGAALANKASLPSFKEARANAVRFLSANDCADAVYSLTLRGNDDVELIRFGSRGGAKTVWKVGA